MLCRVCLLAGASSALLTNDTACITFTAFLLDLCRSHDLPPEPFLLALATSANIGSAATPIGNPQNIVIALQGNVGFGTFFLGVLPATALGLLANTLGLLALYWKQLAKKRPVQEGREEFEMNVNKGDEIVDLQGLETANSSMTSQEKGGNQLVVREVEYSEKEDSEAHRNSTFKPMDAMDWILTEQRGSSEMCSREGGEDHEICVVELMGECSLENGNRKELYGQKTHSSSTGDTLEVSRSQMQKEESLSSRGDRQATETDAMTQANRKATTLLRRSLRKLRISRKSLFTITVYTVTVGMLGCFLAGLDLAWVATGAAVVLIVADRVDAGPMLAKVSYSLLVFFAGMFIAVEGFNATGLPGKLWDSVEPYSRVDKAGGLAVLSSVVTLLSNVASNVPTVLLLGPRIAASAASTPGVSVTRAWLLLAWVSTVAGNLTLVGSAATLIVCEEARFSSPPYRLTFWRHLRYGIPSTLVIITLGVFVVRG